MCGLFGVIFHVLPDTSVQDRAAQAMHLMAGMSSERGTDATGVAIVHRDGSAEVYKDTVPSHDMIRRLKWRGLIDKAPMDVICLMGHTRRRSYGENTQANAHPFVFTTEHGVLVGTHNGGITNHASINPNEKKFDCDSANLFAGMSHVSKDEWPKLLGSLYGAYALAFARNGLVYLTRNYSSPLYYTTDSKAGITIYASTLMTAMAGMAYGRFNWDQVAKELESRKLLEFEPGCSVPLIRDVPFTYTSTVNGGRGYHRYQGTDDAWEGYGMYSGVTPRAQCTSCRTWMSVDALHKFGNKSLVCPQCYADRFTDTPINSHVKSTYTQEMAVHD